VSAEQAPALDEQHIRSLLADFVCNEPCYLICDAVVRAQPEFSFRAGYYLDERGGCESHAWLVDAEGAIADPTHAQFDENVPLLVAQPGSAEADRYLTWADDPTLDIPDWADEIGDDDPLLWLLRGKPGWTRTGPAENPCG